MNEAAIKKTIGELCEVLAAMPSWGPNKNPAEGVYQPHTSTKDVSAEDSLDHLRLQIKYLIFDLEATRRENRYLRQMLENRHGPRSDDSRDG